MRTLKITRSLSSPLESKARMLPVVADLQRRSFVTQPTAPSALPQRQPMSIGGALQKPREITTWSGVSVAMAMGGLSGGLIGAATQEVLDCNIGKGGILLFALGGAAWASRISSKYTEPSIVGQISLLCGNIEQVVSEITKHESSKEKGLLQWCNNVYGLRDAPLIEGFRNLQIAAKDLLKAASLLEELANANQIEAAKRQTYAERCTQLKNNVEEIKILLEILRKQPEFDAQHQRVLGAELVKQAERAADAARDNATANEFNALANSLNAGANASRLSR